MDMDIWKPFAKFLENKEKRRIFAAFFCIKPPQGGFIFAKLRLRRADSRFSEHRKFSSKVLIVAVRSCHCGVLIRGLRTSKLPAKGTFFVLFACTKSTKSTPEVCEPLDSGDDSKLCRKELCRKFRRHVPKPVLPTKRRRKGFESVRKDSCRADARLKFFEKGLLYCKLTVGCRG